MDINTNNIKGNVSETLYGLFLEDINHSCDGGLNANMVRNYSFDDVYLKKGKMDNIRFVAGMVGELEREEGYLRYWNCKYGKLTSRKDDAVSENSRYARLTVTDKALLENNGYSGNVAGRCAMSVIKDHTYTFSAYVRSLDFTGKINVFVTDDKERKITTEAILETSCDWQHLKVTVDGLSTQYGKLVISVFGSGNIDIDCVEFYDNDYWGKENPKWSQGKLRKDLVIALKELNPKFLRFPGGCIIEGLDRQNEYHWKDSVGELIDRKQDYNLWAYEEPDFGYVQSRQIGFYEFFMLCEDLNMEPLPVVWAGMNCQMRKRPSIPFDSEQFEIEVVQNALDLIEYANGDPAKSKWAKLRADSGHPQPFNMKYISIGNENFGEDYLRRFRKVKSAIDEKYPNITCVIGTGSEPAGKNFDYTWEQTKNGLADVYVDEHFYKKPSWVIKQHTRYDNYSRNGAKVFLGEYAAFNVVAGNISKNFVGNRYETALAEAAFLTGIERNSDVVKMTCYAPLFAMIDGAHWKHNLIYFNPKSVMRTANYYVQQLFGTTVQNEIINISSNLPKDIFVSATKSDEVLCIKIVNTGKSPQNINVNVAGDSYSKVKITALQCDDLKKKNSISFSGNVNESIMPTVRELPIANPVNIKIDKYSVYVVQLMK